MLFIDFLHINATLKLQGFLFIIFIFCISANLCYIVYYSNVCKHKGKG